MASLKALKIRINSVKSTQKITKAMKMVAAAKLRRAQEAAQNGRPYAERIERVVARLRARPAYGEALEGQPMEHHVPKPLTMVRILTVLREQHGGAAGWLRDHGWSESEVDALRRRLRE